MNDGKTDTVSSWQGLTAIGGGTQSRLQPSHWPYDKYLNLPEVTPKSRTALLDVEGPGVVTLGAIF